MPAQQQLKNSMLSSPVIEEANRAGSSRGVGGVERVLVDGALDDPEDPSPWFGLGLMHKDTGFPARAASTFWASLERLHSLGAPENSIEVTDASTAMIGSLSLPPNCARVLCRALTTADIREHTEQVTDCLMADKLPAPSNWSWPEESVPHVALIKGPVVLVPTDDAHLITQDAAAAQWRVLGARGHCWVFPAEHMSYQLFAHARKLSLFADRGPASLVPDDPDVETLAVPDGVAVGSTLHLLDTGNFFHLVRDGIASLLLLSTATLCPDLGCVAPRVPLSSILVPDTARWREWVAVTGFVEATHRAEAEAKRVEATVAGATAPSPGLTRPSVVFVRRQMHVTLGARSALAIVDWRRPLPVDPDKPDGLPGALAAMARNSMFSTPHLSVSAGAAVRLVRESLPRVAWGGWWLDDVGGADEAPPRPPSVLYVSRNDSNVPARVVENEGALLHALRAGADTHGWELRPALMGRLSLLSARQLFADAAVVVGPHGPPQRPPPFANPARPSTSGAQHDPVYGR